MLAVLLPVLLSPVLAFADDHTDVGDGHLLNLGASEDLGVPGVVPVSATTTTTYAAEDPGVPGVVPSVPRSVSTSTTEPTYFSPTSTIPPESGSVTVVPATPNTTQASQTSSTSPAAATSEPSGSSDANSAGVAPGSGGGASSSGTPTTTTSTEVPVGVGGQDPILDEGASTLVLDCDGTECSIEGSDTKINICDHTTGLSYCEDGATVGAHTITLDCASWGPQGCVTADDGIPFDVCAMYSGFHLCGSQTSTGLGSQTALSGEEARKALSHYTAVIKQGGAEAVKAETLCPKRSDIDTYHYRDCLALWRWQNLGFHFPPRRGILEVATQTFSYGVGTLIGVGFAIPSVAWKVLGWILKSADISTTWFSVREAANDIFIAVRGTAEQFLGLFVLVAAAIVMFNLLKGPAKSAAAGSYAKGSLGNSIGFRKVLNAVLMIAVPAAVFFWLTSAAAADRKQIADYRAANKDKVNEKMFDHEGDIPPAAFSPWWMVEAANTATGRVLGLVTLAGSDSLSPARLGRVDPHEGDIHSSSCVVYEEKLEVASLATAHASANEGAVAGHAIASGMSKLYKMLVIRAWERAQFGPHSLGTAAGCRLLERYAGVSPDQQFAIDNWNGATSDQGTTWKPIGVPEARMRGSYLTPGDNAAITSNKLIHYLISATAGASGTGTYAAAPSETTNSSTPFGVQAVVESAAKPNPTLSSTTDSGVAAAGSVSRVPEVTYGFSSSADEWGWECVIHKPSLDALAAGHGNSRPTPYDFRMDPRQGAECATDTHDYERYVEAYTAFEVLQINPRPTSAFLAVVTAWIAAATVFFGFAGILLGYALSTIFLTITILLIPVAVILWSREKTRERGTAMFWLVGVAAFSKVLCVLLIEVALLFINLFYSIGLFRSQWLAPLVPLIVVVIMRKSLQKAGVGNIMSLRNGALMTLAVAQNSTAARAALPESVQNMNFEDSMSSQKLQQAGSMAMEGAKGAAAGFATGGWAGVAAGATQGAWAGKQKWEQKQTNLSESPGSGSGGSKGTGKFGHIKRALGEGSEFLKTSGGMKRTEKFRGAVSASAKAFTHRKGSRYTNIPDDAVDENGELTDSGLAHVLGEPGFADLSAAPRKAEELTAAWDQETTTQNFMQTLKGTAGRVALVRGTSKTMVQNAEKQTDDQMQIAIAAAETRAAEKLSSAQTLFDQRTTKAAEVWDERLSRHSAVAQRDINDTFAANTKAEALMNHRLKQEWAQKEAEVKGDAQARKDLRARYSAEKERQQEELGARLEAELKKLGVENTSEMRQLHNRLELLREDSGIELEAASAAAQLELDTSRKEAIDQAQKELAAVKQQYKELLPEDSTVEELEQWVQDQSQEFRDELFGAFRENQHEELTKQAADAAKEHRRNLDQWKTRSAPLRKALKDTQNLSTRETAKYWRNHARISDDSLKALGDNRAADMEAYRKLSQEDRQSIRQQLAHMAREDHSNVAAALKFQKKQVKNLSG